MSNKGKQYSNPSSTGGLGNHFENRVQASFVVLMLAGGFSPCLPTWPISKIKFQGKYQNFDTDDMIIFTKQPRSNKEAKLLGQIKYSISFTMGNKEFGEVIQAAWNDFNKKDIFTEGIDAIVLISGPLSATDTDDVRPLFRQAEHSEDAGDFIKRIELGKFTSNQQRKKLDVFRSHLKVANNNIDLTDDQLWRFMKSFHLLIYDLDIKGVTLSLLHSIIGLYSEDNAEDLLARIEKEVTYKNENAGCLTIDSLPVEIRSAFQRKILKTISEDLIKTPVLAAKMDFAEPDWNHHSYAPDLAFANLLGSWNEKTDADIEITTQLTREEYLAWISKVREILQHPDSPISFKNGVWIIIKRKELWQSIGSRIFDNNLDAFKKCAIEILTERDPKFGLGPEERYAASIYGKVLKYSYSLRKGIVESLALLGSDPGVLTNCSLNKPETIAVLTVREVFENADWVLWGSLNDLLPMLAEAAPNEFLNITEVALQQIPCPFDVLFSQEDNGIFGGNHLSGLLWALESLAWDEKFLVRVSVILGELASHDPGGNWANRPSNSLATIFLPWSPQTTASIKKRSIALQTLLKEFPEIGWKLLLDLLPNQRQMSMGSHKPTWRKTIPDDWIEEVTQNDYWDQVSIYANMAVETAKKDIGKLKELIEFLVNLPKQSFDNVLEHLSSKDILLRPEKEKIDLWAGLIKFVTRHRYFADADWALSSDLVVRIENVASALAPDNPLYLHRELFNGRDFDLIEEKESWQEQQRKLEVRRQQAIKEIFNYGGIDAVFQFSETVESPSSVGQSLGSISDSAIDSVIIPNLLKNDGKNIAQFVSGYIWSRQRCQGWVWVDNIDVKGWTRAQIGEFLANLPFTEETWKRSNVLLGDDEVEYWSRTRVNPYQSDCELGIAIDKLIEYGRPNAAIDCLNKILYDKQSVEKSSAVRALLAAVSLNKPLNSMDGYHIVELIKSLQGDPETNPDDLFQVEWAYLPLLNKDRGASPKLLENRLATDSNFFCEVIRLVYRSKKGQKPPKEPTEQQREIALNAYRLLQKWKTPPGMQTDGSFSGDDFKNWLELTEAACIESGHLKVALTHVGNVLFFSPPDHDGLWIDRTVAEALNGKHLEEMRNGFCQQVFNIRGAHWVDPTGKPERELADKYRYQAEEIENAGYQRFATALNRVAESYDRDAERVITEHKQEGLD
ncbi:MAG TPA: hypothetical protein VGE40_14380 [Bacilli bacterium]